MSERYTRLFALPENLYAAGSPVLLSAGALLKDNQAGRVLVQLKLRSLSPMNIKAVKVSVRPFDTVGAPLGEAVERQYLDLTAARGDEFGTKSPIVMPDAATRSFSAVVTEVAFADNRVWRVDGAPWEPLPIPQPLDTALEDAELVKQFRMTYGEDCACPPMEHKDLWYCTCGARNRREEAVCHRCSREHAALAAIGLDALRAERDERLAAEAEKAEAAEEAARIRAKKAKKAAKIASIVAVAITVAALLTTKVIIPNSKYNAAVDLMEARQYTDAISAFEAMGGYKDSVDQIMECRYLYATTLLESEQLNQAMSLFSALGNYKDSKERLAACQTAIKDGQYDAAVKLLNAGKDWEAYDAFVALGNHKDSKTQASTILNDIYQEVLTKTVSYNDKGEYLLAYNYSNENWDDAFYQVSGYKDLVNEYNYALICSNCEGKWFHLKDYIYVLQKMPSNFRDVSERLKSAQSTFNSLVGFWTRKDDKYYNYAVSIDSSGGVEIGHAKVDETRISIRLYSGYLDAHLEDGKISNVQFAWFGDFYVFGFDLTSNGKLKVQEYYIDEGNRTKHDTDYNGTYEKK